LRIQLLKIADQAIFYLANSENSPIIVVVMVFFNEKAITIYKCNRLLDCSKPKVLKQSCLYTAGLTGPATVMGNGGNVVYRFYLYSQYPKLPDGGFPAYTGTFDVHMNFPQAHLQGLLSGGFGNRLGGKGGRFFSAPEAQPPGTCPGNGIPH
jgi:hypothetical protein